jgi:hypothetical protein
MRARSLGSDRVAEQEFGLEDAAQVGAVEVILGGARDDGQAIWVPAWRSVSTILAIWSVFHTKMALG